MRASACCVLSVAFVLREADANSMWVRGSLKRWGVEVDRVEQERALLEGMGTSDAAFQAASIEDKRAIVSVMRGKCLLDYYRSYRCELCLRYNIQLAEDRSIVVTAESQRSDIRAAS